MGAVKGVLQVVWALRPGHFSVAPHTSSGAECRNRRLRQKKAREMGAGVLEWNGPGALASPMLGPVGFCVADEGDTGDSGPCLPTLSSDLKWGVEPCAHKDS